MILKWLPMNFSLVAKEKILTVLGDKAPLWSGGRGQSHWQEAGDQNVPPNVGGTWAECSTHNYYVL